jgi:adenylate cyclase
MQRAVRELTSKGALPAALHIHVGINTGTVAAGNIGSDRYLQYATIGDATNVASRVCSVAKDGEVVVDERTAARLGTGFELEPLSPIQVKGKTEPLRLHRVRWS